MGFLNVLEEYFRAEKHLGTALTAVGVAVVLFAYWVFRTQTGSFAYWLLVPALVFGLGAGIGGIFLAQRSSQQLSEYPAQYQQDSGGFLAKEGARMERVNANWARIKVVWATVAAVALVLLVVVKKDWSSGLGLALLLFTTVLFFVDVFAERRALVYGEALAEAARSAAVNAAPAPLRSP